MHCRN